MLVHGILSIGVYPNVVNTQQKQGPNVALQYCRIAT